MAGINEIDFEAAKAIAKKIREELAVLRSNGKKLKTEAEAAEATLKDKIAKKNIDGLKSVAEKIEKAASTGEEREREIERWLTQNDPAAHGLDER